MDFFDLTCPGRDVFDLLDLTLVPETLVRGLPIMGGTLLDLGILDFKSSITSSCMPGLNSSSRSSPLGSVLSWLGKTSWRSGRFLRAPGRIGLASRFCRRAGGSSSSLSLSLSLVAPVEEAASALPLKVSSRVDADVRPCETFDISPSLINCNATSLSSSDMQLPTVGSGVGSIPELLFGVALIDCLCGGYEAPPRVRRP